MHRNVSVFSYPLSYNNLLKHHLRNVTFDQVPGTHLGVGGFLRVYKFFFNKTCLRLHPLQDPPTSAGKTHYLNFDMARIHDKLLEKHDLVSE
jgi:hypothetical protein